MRRLLFAMVTVFVGSGCLCSGCMCPSGYGYKDWSEYRKAEWDDRQKKAQPVIDALEAYKAKHEKYPDRLNDLVSEKFLEAIPDLANNDDHQGKPGRVEKAGPLDYTGEGGSYTLRFTFSFTEQAWSSTKDYGFEYASETKKWRMFYSFEKKPVSKPATKKD